MGEWVWKGGAWKRVARARMACATTRPPVVTQASEEASGEEESAHTLDYSSAEASGLLDSYLSPFQFGLATAPYGRAAPGSTADLL